MNTKRDRREAAQKKAKQKKIMILALCSAFLATAIIVIIIFTPNSANDRVFSVPGGQSVTLRENGRFVANLFHDVNISGTFTEDIHENITTISFTSGSSTISTQIEDDVLILPMAWRAACRIHSHEIAFPLVR